MIEGERGKRERKYRIHETEYFIIHRDIMIYQEEKRNEGYTCTYYINKVVIVNSSALGHSS